jgi:hypothetical protein
LAKHHHSSYAHRENYRVATLFSIVHTDVWGPSPTLAILGFKYFVTFMDDFSRMTWIFLMKEISELYSIFCHFNVEIVRMEKR